MNILQRLFRFDHDLTTYKIQFALELMTSLLSMAWFVEARAPYTDGHLWRVSRYLRLLANVAGLDETETARVSLKVFQPHVRLNVGDTAHAPGRSAYFLSQFTCGFTLMKKRGNYLPIH